MVVALQHGGHSDGGPGGGGVSAFALALERAGGVVGTADAYADGRTR